MEIDSPSLTADVTEFYANEEALRESHLEKAQLLASETAAKEASRLKCFFSSFSYTYT